jgi:N-acetylglucosaminyldiphosphoundecaprenol N-acetyl-beta-D-mannosaminyltransferase
VRIDIDGGGDAVDELRIVRSEDDDDVVRTIDLNALVATPPPARKVVGIRIDQTSYDDAVGRIVKWARNREPRYVTVNSVNNVMTAHQDPAFAVLSNGADLATPDGMPLVWTLRRLGLRGASRVCGPSLTPRLFHQAQEAGVPIGLYGGTPEVLEDLERQISARWPELEIAYSYSPPFRQLTEEEDRQVVSDIVGSGARILFVGIGCPKQEVWMARHKADLPLVQIGVGAAFDLLAGHRRQAPAALQDNGLEWLYRLACEPRRLWRRYMRQNPRFVWLVARQIMVTKRPPRPSRMQVRGVGSDRSR